MAVGAGADLTQTAPLLIGCIFTWFLSGSLMVQTYDYFGAYHIQADNVFIQSVVGAAFIINQLRSMSVTSIAWQGLVTQWGESRAFHGSTVFQAMSIPLTGLESCIVQFFFAWRIATLRRDSKVCRFVSALISLLALMQFVAAILRGVLCYQFQNTTRSRVPVQLSAKVWLSGTFVCDFIIVTTMTTLLIRAKVGSSLRSTRRLLDRLIVISVETAAVTLIATLLQLIFYVKFPTNGRQQVSIMYILGGLYSNALVAVLNGRQRSRSRLAEPTLSLHFTEKSTPHGRLSASDNEGSEVQLPNVK